MAGVSLVNVHAAGGTIVGAVQTFVRVNGSPVALVGAAIAPHGIGPHAAAAMAQGSTLARINGVAICREGDAATCGHTANGLDWFNIGG